MAGEHSPRKALLDRALRLFQQGYEHQMSGELDEDLEHLFRTSEQVATRVRAVVAIDAEDRAATAYERELYAATYGYGGRP